MKARIRLIRLDESDVSVGLKFGDVLIATPVIHGDGVVYYIVDAPKQKDYYICNAQVEAVA